MPHYAEASVPEWAVRLRDWQQGDYTLDIKQVVVVSGIEDGEMVPAAGDAVGIVLVSQTCDIVNFGPGKEWVVVAPLVEVNDVILENAKRASTPAFAVLDSPPAGNVLVDLSQATTLHKSVLATLTRHVGLTTDTSKVRFGSAVARKYGRFAFPDDFSNAVLSEIRKRISRSHARNSDQGRAYASLATIRVAASPSWDAREATVGFRFVLEPNERRQLNREAIAKVLHELVAKIEWPTGYRPEDPPFTLTTVDEMTAGEWLDSQEIDLDYISLSTLPEG